MRLVTINEDELGEINDAIVTLKAYAPQASHVIARLTYIYNKINQQTVMPEVSGKGSFGSGLF